MKTTSKLRKLLSIGAVLVVSLGLWGCSNNAEETTEEEKPAVEETVENEEDTTEEEEDEVEEKEEKEEKEDKKDEDKSNNTSSSNSSNSNINNSSSNSSNSNSNSSSSGNNSNTTPGKEPNNSIYKDGVYTGSASGYSGNITVKVTIKNDKITNVQVTKTVDTEPFISKAISGIVNSILSNQSSNVDVVTGATHSSKGIINAVNNALAQAKR